jgi:1-acyl-sn-glycerol-3-phosphate acyltransferase
LKKITEPPLDKNFIEKAFYLAFKFYVKLCLKLYFGKIYEHNKGSFSNSGTILFANHQNAFLDALLLVCFSNSNIWFLTRADIFKNPISRRILFFFQMLPMFRERDGFKALQNVSWIEQQCLRILKTGGVIGIFPEATHDQRWVLRPVKKGVSRLIFAAYTNNIKVEPVGCGIIYYHHTKSGFPVVLNFSDKLNLPEISLENKAQNVNEITTLVGEKLENLIPFVPFNADYYALAAKQIKISLVETPLSRLPSEIPAINSELNKLAETRPEIKYSDNTKTHFLSHNIGLKTLWLIAMIPISPFYFFIDKIAFGLVADKQFYPSLKLLFWAILWPIYPIALYFIFDLSQKGLSLFLIILLFLLNVITVCSIRKSLALVK